MADLLDITTRWASGSSAKELQPAVKSLIGGLDNEALVEVFQILPRALSMPHFAAFRKAEEESKSTKVSEVLVSTNFEDCGPVESLVETISYAVARVPSEVSAPHAEAAFEWRKKLCVLAASSKTSVDFEAHAHAAMVYALSAPSFLVFEDLHDAVSTVKIAKKETKLLAEFIDTVLLAGAGAGGYDAFVAKAGPKFFESHGIESQGLRKAHLLSLCTIMAGKKHLKMDDIATGLRVANAAEAERLVVDAALANIVDVEVDRNSGTVTIKSVMPLRFDAKALKALGGVIDANITVVEQLLASYQQK